VLRATTSAQLSAPVLSGPILLLKFKMPFVVVLALLDAVNGLSWVGAFVR